MNTILLIQLIILTTTIFNIGFAAEKPAQFLGTILCEPGNWDAGHVDLVKKDIILDEQILTKSNLNEKNEFDFTTNVDLNNHIYLKIHYECGNGRTGVQIFDKLTNFLKKVDEKDVFNITDTIHV